MKLLRRCIFGIVSIGVLICVLLLVLPDRYVKSLVIKVTHSLTDRQLHIGTFELERGLIPRLTVKEVAFSNADWASQEFLFAADSISVSIQLSKLFSGQLIVQDYSSTGIKLHLETGKKGKKNWQLSSKPRPLPPLPGISIVSANANDTLVTFLDKKTSRNQRLILSDVMLSNDASDAGPKLLVTGDINSLPVSAALTLQSEKPGSSSISAALSLPYRLEVTAGDIRVLANGQVNDVGDALLDSVVFLEMESLSQLGEVINQPLPDIGPINLQATLAVNANLTGVENVYEIELQHIDFKSDYIDAELSGTVTDILKTALVDVSVKLDTPDLSLVTKLSGVEMPPEWGPITATAKLQGQSGAYALNEINATLNGNSKAHAVGSIKSFIPFENMHLNVDVSLSTLDEISTFTPNPLPDLGPFTGTGVIGWHEGSLFLTDARVSHKSQHGIAVVTGKIGDLIHFDKVRLRADADLPDFSALELFTGFKLPEVDRVVASTNLISANALDLSARQLTVSATLDDVTVVGTGAVESIIKRDISVALMLESNVDSLTQLNELTGRQLPELGPLQTTAQLTGTGQQFALKDINATLSGSNLTGTLTSQFIDLRILDELAFDVALQANDVSAVAFEFGLKKSISAPAQLSTKIRVSGKNLHLENTDIDIDANQIRGNLSMLDIFDDQLRTKLRGDVMLVNIDTTTLFDHAVTTLQKQPDPRLDNELSQQAQKRTRVLPGQPLPFSSMMNDHIEINLQIQELTSKFLDVKNAKFDVRARDGILTIGPFTGIVNEGQVDIIVAIDTRNEPTKVNVNLTLDEFNLARAMVFNGTDLIESSGGAWITLSITGEGSSVADIMGSATGAGGIYIEDLLFKEDVLSIFSSDLIDQLADALNPFADKNMMDTQLLCSAIMFQIQDGLLETPFGFATEASDFSVVGEAQVDFNDETLEMMFNTKPKKGLGISLNRLAGLVKLKGAIASPSLTLNETGLLQFGASIAAAVASGGVTLLAEGLYNKNEAHSDVCAQALGD